MSEPSSARIEAARKLIAEAKALGTFDAARPKTKQDEVRVLREDIEGLRAEGATWEQIAKVLQPVLHAGPDTIRLAIGGGKKTDSSTTSRTKPVRKLARAANGAAPKRRKNSAGTPPEKQAEQPPKPAAAPTPPAVTNHPVHAAQRRADRKP